MKEEIGKEESENELWEAETSQVLTWLELTQFQFRHKRRHLPCKGIGQVKPHAHSRVLISVYPPEPPHMPRFFICGRFFSQATKRLVL
ncbi:hypothetical protein SK128_015644, partial [Halocaridina rubra]